MGIHLSLDTVIVGHLVNISFKHCFSPDGLIAINISQQIMAVVLTIGFIEMFTRWPTIKVSNDKCIYPPGGYKWNPSICQYVVNVAYVRSHICYIFLILYFYKIILSK